MEAPAAAPPAPAAPARAALPDVALASGARPRCVAVASPAMAESPSRARPCPCWCAPQTRRAHPAHPMMSLSQDLGRGAWSAACPTPAHSNAASRRALTVSYSRMGSGSTRSAEEGLALPFMMERTIGPTIDAIGIAVHEWVLHTSDLDDDVCGNDRFTVGQRAGRLNHLKYNI